MLSIPPILASITLANAEWDAFVQSAESAVTDLGGAKHLFIALGILLVLLINLRLARWLSASIKFEPPPHHPKHPHHPQHHTHDHHH